MNIWIIALTTWEVLSQKRDVARLTSMGIRAHLHPLLHNMISIYITLLLASPVPISILLHPIILTITYFITPLSLSIQRDSIVLGHHCKITRSRRDCNLTMGGVSGWNSRTYVQQAKGPMASPLGVPHTAPQHIMVNDSFPPHSHPQKKLRKKRKYMYIGHWT